MQGRRGGVAMGAGKDAGIIWWDCWDGGGEGPGGGGLVKEDGEGQDGGVRCCGPRAVMGGDGGGGRRKVLE